MVSLADNDLKRGNTTNIISKDQGRGKKTAIHLKGDLLGRGDMPMFLRHQEAMLGKSLIMSDMSSTRSA